MRTLEGVYKAVCLGVDNQGEVIRCQVPQIFNDETVTCFDVAGGVFPIEGDEGWVLFESGYPDHPIWLAASEGISSPDVTPGVGVIDVSAGVGIAVTPGQHPVVTNMGVLSVVAGARVTINNTNAQVPVVTANPQYAAGGALDTLLAKNSAADYDTKWVTPTSLGFVAKAGDTMTGRLWVEVGNAPSVSVVGTGVHMEWWTNGRAARTGYFQGNSNGLLINSETGSLGLASSTGTVNLNNALNVGASGAHGAGYNGLHWGSNYLIMTANGSDTLITAPNNGGNVSIRGGYNNAYQFNVNSSGNHQIIGNVDHAGYSISSLANLDASGIITCRGFNLSGTNSFYFNDFGGGWYMTDGQWIRATNNKDVYSGGTFQMGALQCNGGASTAGLTTDDINTRGQRRITSNGGNGGAYYNHAYLAQNGADSRTGYSMHPGGVAKSMDMIVNNGYINFLNEDGGGYAQLYCFDITQVSQRKMKQDITPWPVRSAGSAVMGAASRLSLIDVISYRAKAEQALIDAETMERHECGPDSCGCTDEDPCHRVKEWQNPMLGVIIEDLATVLPEAVGLDPDGNPGGQRIGTMIGFLIAVCKEQQERIEALEQNHQEAA